MRVFVTGASGWCGTAVVPELIAAGHTVVGLARSDEAAAKVQAVGAQVQRGDLEDLDGLRAGAAAADAVVHLGFVHDFSRYDDSLRIDLAAIDALGTALEGSDRPLVVASGIAAEHTPGSPATENDPPSPAFPRGDAALKVLGFAERGVRSSIVRLPPTVHGTGDAGFIATLVQVARQKGVAGYIGDGANRWPAVHRSDAARLFALAVDQAPPGSTLHAVGDQGVPTRAIAEAIAPKLGIPTRSIDLADAGDHFGWIAFIVGLDLAATSAITQERFGWRPSGPSLLDDLEAGHYFT